MQSRIKVFIGLSARALGLIAVLPATAQQATSAPPAATGSTASQATAVQDDLSEIVVTARQRSETLNRVPVVVSVVTPAALEHNNATDLPKIAETVPGLIVAGYSAGGGGTIAIRGISSPPNNAGFEQAVSVAVDGVQTSDGHIALLGMFDLQQVEVLKGPQSLLFGKNNTAGIISIKTADPTDRPLYSIKQAYEFVGDESTTDVVASGPMTDFLGARLAIEYRNLDGWLHNTATPMANPFYNPATGAPANASQLPGASDSRVGNSNVLGRLTFKSELGSAVTARLKIFGAQTNSQGPGVEAQNIGPCSGPYPRIYGVADPTADCKVDNRTTVGDVPAAVASRDPIGNTTGKGFGLETALADTLDLAADLDKVRLNSITGFTRTTDHYMAGADQTDYSQLLSSEVYTIRQISQELRATSKFDGPLNFMVGGFYQGTRIYYRSDITYLTSNYNAASDRFDSYDQVTNQHGSSYSAFAQVLINFTSELELAGGARYTYEKKDFDSRNLYGIGAFATQNTLFAGSDTPGVLRGRFSDHNVSPEVTLTWRPDSNQTYFAAYRTGFKSGGFGLSNPPQTTAIPSDYQFNSETARGGEIGAKLLFLDNRLSVSADAFLYNFDNLQVGVFNPDRFAFIVSNAGALRQRGSELETNFRVNRMLNLRGAVTYARNRFHDYVGQCYSYTFPTGTTRGTAVAPPNCQFLNATSLTLVQNFEGRAPSRSPDWSSNAGFELNAPAGKGVITLTGDAFYTGFYFANDLLQPGSQQNAYWRFNSSLTLHSADDLWSVGFVGRNLTNRYVLTYATGRTGGAGLPGYAGEQRGVVARGREISLVGSLRF